MYRDITITYVPYTYTYIYIYTCIDAYGIYSYTAEKRREGKYNSFRGTQ